jgi:hypothetical protein
MIPAVAPPLPTVFTLAMDAWTVTDAPHNEVHGEGEAHPEKFDASLKRLIEIAEEEFTTDIRQQGSTWFFVLLLCEARHKPQDGLRFVEAHAKVIGQGNIWNRVFLKAAYGYFLMKDPASQKKHRDFARSLLIDSLREARHFKLCSPVDKNGESRLVFRPDLLLGATPSGRGNTPLLRERRQGICYDDAIRCICRKFRYW